MLKILKATIAYSNKKDHLLKMHGHQMFSAVPWASSVYAYQQTVDLGWEHMEQSYKINKMVPDCANTFNIIAVFYIQFWIL